MSDERELIEHPSWCDPHACTAPKYRPTLEEYKGAAVTLGKHQSGAVLAYNGRGDLAMSLQQAVCPWDTDVYLSFAMGDEGMGAIPVSMAGGGMALFELLAEEIGAATRRYPALYAERFGYVADATSSGDKAADTPDVGDDESDEATADAFMPRDPVELEERMTAEFLADEEVDEAAERAHQELGKVVKSRLDYERDAAPAVTDPDAPKRVYAFIGCDPCGSVTTCAPAGKCWRGLPEAYASVEDPSPGEGTMRKALYPMSYRLTVNGKTDPYPTFEEVRAAVADLVTRRLGAEPERVAAEAGALNAEFSSGKVLGALDEGRDWYTVFDAYGEEPLRIRITAERD